MASPSEKQKLQSTKLRTCGYCEGHLPAAPSAAQAGPSFYALCFSFFASLPLSFFASSWAQGSLEEVQWLPTLAAARRNALDSRSPVLAYCTEPGSPESAQILEKVFGQKAVVLWSQKFECVLLPRSSPEYQALSEKAEIARLPCMVLLDAGTGDVLDKWEGPAEWEEIARLMVLAHGGEQTLPRLRERILASDVAPETRLYYAEALWRFGKLREARTEFEKLMGSTRTPQGERGGGESAVPAWLATLAELELLGMEAETGKTEAARMGLISLLERGLESDLSQRAWYYLGLCELAAGRVEPAQELSGKIRATDRNAVWARKLDVRIEQATR